MSSWPIALALGVFLGVGQPVAGDAAPVAGAGPARAQTAIIGDWDGTLHVGVANFRLALHVKAGPTGDVATLNSIDQGAMRIPLTDVAVAGRHVTLAVKAIGAVFQGDLASDAGVIAGSWTQGGRSFPLTFARRPPGQPQARLARPQEPAAPFPYLTADVTFDGLGGEPGARLAGTLTEPKGPGPFPAVVLIAGSGPNTRDEVVAGHKPFLVLADYLTRRGIAVLRYDKRGVGGSGGDYAQATTLDFADDAQAAVAFLRSRPGIDRRRIGLVGHSEGGLIAPIVVDRDPAVAFSVLLAALGETGAAILAFQGRAMARLAGVSSAEAARAQALNARLFAAVARAKDVAEARAEVAAILVADPKLGRQPPAALATQASALATPWFRFFLTYDPIPALAKMRGPVLVLSGSKDLQVPPDENLPSIRAALAHDSQATVEELPGLNHLFQTAQTGSPAEYATIEETMAPAALRIIGDWIERVGAAGR